MDDSRDASFDAAPPERDTEFSRPIPNTAPDRNAPPRTDVGTIVLHWATAIAFTVSLFTGLRIAADGLHAVVSKWLSPILPQGEIWTWHFFAGLTLFFCGSSYLLYMVRSGLAQRNALKKTRLLAMPAPRKMKWGAVNVILHWLVYALVVFLTCTGVLLYLGWGGWWVYLHSTAAFIGLSLYFRPCDVRTTSTADGSNCSAFFGRRGLS